MSNPIAEIPQGGLCATGIADPDLWSSISGEARRQAKDICRQCPVRRECLIAAERTRQSWGIWGGVDMGESRRRARRESTARAKARASS